MEELEINERSQKGSVGRSSGVSVELQFMSPALRDAASVPKPKDLFFTNQSSALLSSYLGCSPQSELSSRLRPLAEQATDIGDFRI